MTTDEEGREDEGRTEPIKADPVRTGGDEAMTEQIAKIDSGRGDTGTNRTETVPTRGHGGEDADATAPSVDPDGQPGRQDRAASPDSAQPEGGTPMVREGADAQNPDEGVGGPDDAGPEDPAESGPASRFRDDIPPFPRSSAPMYTVVDPAPAEQRPNRPSGVSKPTVIWGGLVCLCAVICLGLGLAFAQCGLGVGHAFDWLRVLPAVCLLVGIILLIVALGWVLYRSLHSHKKGE